MVLDRPPHWRAEGPTPKVAWLRQLLPERDPYGASPAPSAIDDLLIRRRQWLAWTRVFGQLGTRWFNDPLRTYVAESKVYQLAVAGGIGFDVPRTLLTFERDEAANFNESYGPCIVKSVTTAFWEFSDQSFVFTSEADEAITAEPESWRAQPVFVQERIDGSHDARLFVIGDEVLGARRHRDSLDWRTDPNATWRPWNPDRLTAKRAVAYTRDFDLDYGAFDFIIGSKRHGGPVFLECNPSGEFGFLDDVLDRRLSESIGRLLVRLVYGGTRTEAT